MAARKDNTKRLYRDPEHAVVGGVCAGIAEYLNIDVLLARITALVLLAMTLGASIVLYFVLWTVLPVKSKETSVIDIKPASISSERYSKVVAAHKPDKRRKKGTGETDRAETGRPAAEETKGHAYLSRRRSIVVFVLLCLLSTIVIALLANMQSDLSFWGLTPLYLVPFGVLLVTSSHSALSFSTRVCLMLLCFEACLIALPFTIGLCTVESLLLIDNTTFLIWFIAAVFLLAAAVFNNAVCYAIAIILIFLAILLSFSDFGIFEPAMFIAWIDPELRPALGI